MEHVRDPFITPPGLSSSPRPVSARSAGSRRSGSGHDHLGTQFSLLDETDPPPFVPSPDDHTSLNQVDDGAGGFFAGEIGAMGMGTARLHRRSTSSMQPGTLHNSQLPSTYQKHSTMTHRARASQGVQPLRRETSAPGKKAMRIPSKPHWPSPANLSSPDSQCGEDDPNTPPDISPRSSREPLIQPQGNYQRIRADSLSSVSVPHEIRLRRASDKAVDYGNRRISLSGPKPIPLRQHLEQGLNFVLANKSSLAGEALTQAYVHTYFPVEHDGGERRSSVGDGRRRLSATLQVVRSRDSVYEVIWEDVAALTESTSATSSTSSSSLSIRIPSHWTTYLEPKRRWIETDLASFSWGGELKPYSKCKPASAEDKHSEREGSSGEQDSDLRRLDTTTSATNVSCNAASDHKEENRQNSTNDSACEIKDLSGSAERMKMASKLPRPAPTPLIKKHLDPVPKNGEWSRQKFSNLPFQEDHFMSHRDSLILAHNRIFHDRRGPHGERAVPRVAELRKVSWHKPITSTPGDCEYKRPPPKSGASLALPSAPASIDPRKQQSILCNHNKNQRTSEMQF